VKDRLELETVLCERAADGVVVVTMNRPGSANAILPQSARDLLTTLDEIDGDLSVRCGVLTGAGRHFCAGADLSAFKTHLENELKASEEPFNARLLFPVTQRITTLRVPMIAAINGAATAGGFDLALACDIRIASTTARMGETYVNIGLAPGNGGTYFLPRLVGSGKAAELALTGEILDAAAALELGIVTRVVGPDELVAVAVALASTIASKPRRGVEATKHMLRTSWHTDLAGSLGSSFWVTSALQNSRDLKEGIDASLEKRTPRYNTTVNRGDSD
jgi:enoyl-CoA hydratase